MRILYMPKAVRDLERFPLYIQKRITDKIDFYAAQSDPLTFAERLTGVGAYRFRIGNYRVTVEIGNNAMFIMLIKKRDESTYKGLS